MVFILAMIYDTAMVDFGSHPSQQGERQLARLFRSHGWVVQPPPGDTVLQPDLIVRKGALHYAIELKNAKEGRSDRALAQLSQAILQAKRHAGSRGMQPLAILYFPHAPRSLFKKLEQFHRDYAADVAIGLVSESGGSIFIGPGLDSLNEEFPANSKWEKSSNPRKSSDLFSDLNQWMLKVLLAPELPEALLSAPRGAYRTISELAEAAKVSAMSASRFVRRLKEERFLDESGQALRVVRRRELFRRWQAVAMRSSPELQMSFLIPNAGIRQLNKATVASGGCLGLFSAAERLGLSHVSGVPPYLYVRRIPPSFNENWHGLLPSGPGELPQLILAQANAPESLFRGAVHVGGVPVSDVVQVWLDASAHPSRGAEQANLLRHKVLAQVMGEHE